MNKKDYSKPAMRVVKIQHTGMLMTSNEVTGTSNDVGLEWGGGGSGPAHARSFGGWDDEEE